MLELALFFSDSWVTTRGVSQGGVLSAFLFSLYLDDILTEISAMPVGCRLGINKINVQAYADRRVFKGGAFGARVPPLSLMPNEKIYGD